MDRCSGASDPRKASTAIFILSVDAPVLARENRPGTMLPSVVTPLKSSAGRGVARSSVLVMKSVDSGGIARADQTGRSRKL